MKPLFRQISIIGLGLMGGSLGMALRKGRVARRVIGFSRHESTLRRAKARGAIDDGDTELCPDWLGESDLVVIATPPLTVPKIARDIARICPGRLLLTDVASTKSLVVREVEKVLPPRMKFVGGHPMAGSEQSGVEAADAKLFRNVLCLLTPTARTDRKAVARVASLWRGVGCRVRTLSPGQHDAWVAEISHLPHLAAVGLTLTPGVSSLRLAGPGFTDTTRVAAGDPALWEEICSTNSRSVRAALDRFIRQMQDLRRQVGGKDIRKSLQAAQHRRGKVGRG